ncbi:MAG TPA: methylmalonyl-CoA mutase family protein [Thermomicrobiales bacterium]|mgnify:CR=1 FL=1|jgi:methylmalonyl-CoA mutase N-terminal domain/subunit|nr:methylmalonyl-CoA mutase [Chloroflexota bacterium]HCG31074.1 methylmalonyl-CoA mutase [Chloroflexota bacterium]HQZ88841.1 methylmalonyl-CoA mutase family protein [Thermomicrobiales bacterium]HRA31653.1 methylmalonyl-CoA mutase family protein [Thermomicrobiales bacterium]
MAGPFSRMPGDERYAGSPPDEREFTTVSGEAVQSVYAPADLRRVDFDYQRDLGDPGAYPFTRGIHSSMYRGKLWTIRMFAGFGSAEETNARFRYLLDHGETGLSIAFDLPTLYGRDTDDPLAAGEFGKCGVAVSSLADMEALLDEIPLDVVTTSMTINGPAAVIWAMYIATAEKRGVPRENLRGTLQNDILKEFTSQNEFIFPPSPSMKLVTDTIEFATREMPLWNSISISGYHIREAGATATEELAFTLADGLAYVDAALERGLDIDEFAPRLSFFFNCHNDFFEEISKFRAARRIWARLMRERYGAKNERSLWLRFHTQTAGCSLTAQEPENNVIRTTIQALAAVLGGTQSLHTNSLDEAIALPSEWAARIAVRTQQILASESGIANITDPLGGSYAVETMTTEMEQRVLAIFDEIESYGGVVPAIEEGYFLRRIADSSYRYQQALADQRKIIVGVNAFRSDEEPGIPLLQMDPHGEGRQIERLRRVRDERDPEIWRTSIERLENAARAGENVMPWLIDAANAYATLGEITNSLRRVYGEYRQLLVV